MSTMGTQAKDFLNVLKELQKTAKIQQQQIDTLIACLETSVNANVAPQPQGNGMSQGMKRPLSSILEYAPTNTAEPPEPVKVEEHKDYIDKIFEKEIFRALWDKMVVKIDIDSSVERLQNKEKIKEILTKASEMAKLLLAVNYNHMILHPRFNKDYKNIDADGSYQLQDMTMRVTNSQEQANERPVYAHDVNKFSVSMAQYAVVLEDPNAHFIRNPVKKLLSESCFSHSYVPNYRAKRHCIIYALCCIRKPGFLSFFVCDWAFEDRNLPNLSYIKHYATLEIANFIDEAELNTDAWRSIEAYLEQAACPTDLSIGSITNFIHEHRGNIVCGKVVIDKVTAQEGLRLYPHATSSYTFPTARNVISYNDDGEVYLERIHGDQDIVMHD